MENLNNTLKETHRELYNALYNGDFMVIGVVTQIPFEFIKIRVKDLELVIAITNTIYPHPRESDLCFTNKYSNDDARYYIPDFWNFFNYSEIVKLRIKILEHLNQKI